MAARRRDEIADAVARSGFVNVRARSELGREVRRMAAAGVLRRLHPGVYVPSDEPPSLAVRLRAALAWAPGAVVTGRAAAKLTLWPELPVTTIDLASPVRRVAQPGLRVVKRTVPASLVEVDRGIRRTSVPLTVADLLPELGSGIVVRAFRAGWSPEAILRVLEIDARRRGHAQRREIIHDHRDRPWSEAEQDAHVLLRGAGITDWQANVSVEFAPGRSKVFDIVFDDLKVVVEVDGYAYHHQERRATYERDRLAASSLTAQGWLVIRVTPRQLAERPAWVLAVVRGALACAERRDLPLVRR